MPFTRSQSAGNLNLRQGAAISEALKREFMLKQSGQWPHDVPLRKSPAKLSISSTLFLNQSMYEYNNRSFLCDVVTQDDEFEDGSAKMISPGPSAKHTTQESQESQEVQELVDRASQEGTAQVKQEKEEAGEASQEGQEGQKEQGQGD